MTDDQTRPVEPDAPEPPPRPEAQQPLGQPQQPAYAAPAPQRAYAAGQRPRFVDQVLGMRAVVAVAIACLIMGGLSGWILGHAAANDGRRGPIFFQRGPFTDGPDGPPGPQGRAPGQSFGEDGRS